MTHNLGARGRTRYLDFEEFHHGLLAHAREVFRAAILAGSAGIVATHNHPSGHPEPSAEDPALTRRLAAAGSLLGIEVLDHIITGDATKAWVSLKERGVV